MRRFETEILYDERSLTALTNFKGGWIDRILARTLDYSWTIEAKAANGCCTILLCDTIEIKQDTAAGCRFTKFCSLYATCTYSGCAMYLLYCDESNLQKKDYDFFVYGGLVIDGQAAYSLSLEIDNIRKRANIPQDFVLKFNPGPSSFSNQEFINLKQNLIEVAISHGCIFLTSLILHNVATSPYEARRNAINTICFHYDCYLDKRKSYGLVLIDRFEDKKIDEHLREKFLIGVIGLPHSEQKRLKHIIGFHYVAKGQSHFGSIVDIVLGSFRFAINAFTRCEEKNIDTAKNILNILSPLFYKESISGHVSKLSFF